MAAIQSVALSRRAGRRGGLVAALLLAGLTVGCATTEEFFRKTQTHPNGPPVGQVVCTWQNAVRFASDPARHGEMNAGIVGRMYLFDPDLANLLEGDGSVAVFLYDETNGPPTMLEAWNFDAVTLKRLMRKDRYGTGYTVFLPWGKYRPDITKIRLRVRYQPEKGAPHFTENALTLAPGNGTFHETGGLVTRTSGTKAK